MRGAMAVARCIPRRQGADMEVGNDPTSRRLQTVQLRVWLKEQTADGTAAGA
jgi:hypothetical protein